MIRLALPLCLALLASACPAADNLLPNGDFARGLDGWWYTQDATLQAAVVATDAPGCTKAARLVARPKPGAKPWDVALAASVPAPVSAGSVIVVAAWLRGPDGCPVTISVQLSQPPYSNFATQTVTPGAAWREVRVTATAPRDLAARELGLSFHLGTQAGTTEVAGVRVSTANLRPPGLVPFVLPWDDAAGSATNVAGWLPKPAGRDGQVVARDGHLYTGNRRFRVLGTNICAGAAFAAHEVAEKAAARLAKFGINCVRWHHMDSGWARPTMMADDRRHIAPAAVERFDYFFAQCKRQGIYSDINLHVSREYPGMPKWPRMPEFYKGVDLFYPPMVEMQREYARELLTHVNPYTKLAYTDDPAVAFIEINNENGLISQWQWGSLDAMPALYADELTRQWNTWLAGRYRDEAAWRAAWVPQASQLGAELLRGEAAAWTLERTGGGQGTATSGGTAPGNQPATRIEVTAVDGEGWHVQYHQAGLKVTGGQAYTLTFQARAEPARSISVDCRLAHAPWTTLWETNLNLTPTWRTYQLVITPAAADDNARVSFGNLGAKTGRVELAGVSFRPGGSYALREGDAWGRVAWVRHEDYSGLPPAMKQDWMRFMWETEERYWTGLARFIKDELKAKALVFGSAAGFSPALVQAQLDVVDGHAYWQHPHFPGQPWDQNNWVVNNQPMAGVRGGANLAHLAGTRVFGKPYLVTEYNHPAPNTYNAEAFVLMAAYAALQDWDGFFSFDYHSSVEGWDGQKISGFFSMDRHPTQMATLPAAAALFLRGDVSAPAQRLAARATRELALDLVAKHGSFVGLSAFGVPGAAVLQRPIGLSLDGATAARVEPAAGPTVVSDNGELTWDSSVQPGRVVINTPRSQGLIGNTTGGPLKLAGADLVPGPNLQQWACLLLTALDGADLTAPGRILITAAGYCENTGMGWQNAEKNTVGSNWGVAPSLVEVIPAVIRLKVPAARVKAWALDERGQRQGELAVRDEDGRATIAIGPAGRTVWYEVVIGP